MQIDASLDVQISVFRHIGFGNISPYQSFSYGSLFVRFVVATVALELVYPHIPSDFLR
jgi:hypothetical protein